MIFKSSKDTTVCIRHITNINPFRIDCTHYQESINLLMEGFAQEKVAANKNYFEWFNTIADFAKYDIQLQLGKLNVWYKGDIASLFATKSMEVMESTVKESILMSLFIVDIHNTMFTTNKGIWAIETTVEDLHKALADVKTLLE
eukprot:12524473-Ditylum_brightwellii.AAC.1